jgi:hypothetical protein
MDWINISTFLIVATINAAAAVAALAHWRQTNDVTLIGLAVPLGLMAIGYGLGAGLLWAGVPDTALNNSLWFFLRFNNGCIAFAILLMYLTNWRSHR